MAKQPRRSSRSSQKSDSETDFLSQNTDVWVKCAQETGVFLQARPDVIGDGTLTIMIPVSENTTVVNVRKAAKYAIRLRERLLAYQGVDTDPSAAFLEELSRRRREDHQTFYQIAESLNRQIDNCLRQAVVFDREVYDMLIPTLSSEEAANMEMFLLSRRNPNYGIPHITYANIILDNIGMNTEEANQWIDDGFQNALQGEPPFAFDEQPISSDFLKEKLKTWHKGRKHRALQSSTNERKKAIATRKRWQDLPGFAP